MSLWYEVVSPHPSSRAHRPLQREGIDDEDVVIDDQRDTLAAAVALRPAKYVGRRILAIGGPSGWATPDAPKRARERFKLDIQTVSYDELGKLIKEARADQAAVDAGHDAGPSIPELPGTTLETERKFVDNAFLLEQVFRS